MGSPATRKHYLLPLIAGTYTLLLIYGSLYPLTGWHWPGGENWFLLFERRPRYLSKSDLIANFLIYVPFGLLLAFGLKARFRRVWTLSGATILYGMALSFSMESLQLFLPNRVSSLTDVAMNTAGAAAGASLALIFNPDTMLGRRLSYLRMRWFRPGLMTDLGLVILGLWALAELTPLIPSLDFANLSNGFAPLRAALQNHAHFSMRQTLIFSFHTIGLGFLAATLIRDGRLFLLFPAFVICVLLLKIPVVSQQITLEALLGCGTGLLILFAFRRFKRNHTAAAGIGIIVAAYAIAQLDFGGFSLLQQVRPFNWVPFHSRIGYVTRLADILATVWPFLAVAYLALFLRPRNAIATAAGGAVLVGAFTFALEWNQQSAPARYADITTVILALAAWTLPWLHPVLREGRKGR